MVLPNRHVQRMGQLSIDETRRLFEEVRRMERLLEATFGCEGINVGINMGEAAGAAIGNRPPPAVGRCQSRRRRSGSPVAAPKSKLACEAS